MLVNSGVARMARRLSPAVIAAAIGLLGLAPGAQADVRVEKNYRLTSDPSPFRGKDQVALAVNPTNPKHIVETNANYLTEDCEATASFDGGVTWTEAVPLLPPAGQPLGSEFQPSCRISNHLGESMFQTVAFGAGQNVYATSITPRRASFGGVGEEGAGTLVYKSTDGGMTWGPGVVAMAGGPSNPTGNASKDDGPNYELPTLAVQPGAGPGGADRVYSVAHETSGFGNSGPPCPQSRCASVRTAVSNSGGQSFAAPVQASPPGVPIAGPDSASQPVISPNGDVSVAWRTRSDAAGPGPVTTGVGTIQIARSTNQGQSWGAPVNVTNVTNNAKSFTSHVTPTLSSGASFPRLAVDRTNGNLYVVYNQGAPGPTPPPGGYQGSDHFITPDSRVYFQRSVNNGASWSKPQLISDMTARPGTPTVQTRHPSVSVAPNGRVDIVWEDRRHWYQGPGERNCIHTHLFCDDARMGDTYYANSTDGGSTFSENRRVSDRSNNNDVGYDYRFGVGWAFGPQLVALGNDQVLIGWMDSREGSFDDDNLDIYLARVNLNAPATIPQTNVNEPEAVPLSVALSKVAYPAGGEGLLNSVFATRSGTRVVIVKSDDVAGALAGGVLARANVAPVLLSPTSGLSSSVKDEVARLDPAGAFIVGDTGQLSDQVKADLVAAGVDEGQVVRVTGSGEAGTAAQIAALVDKRTPAEKTAGNPALDAAVIANPNGPDAGAAAGLAAARRLPILYVTKDTLPAATSAALGSLNIDKTLVIGGTEQVGDTVMGQLPSPTRLGGADQYATSKAVVAESKARGLPSNMVYVADGTRTMDAALLGPVVARATGTLLLSQAPLFGTAAGAASSAGLTGIDRLVVVGPAPPAPTQSPTPSPTYVIPTPTPTATPNPRKRPGLSATVRPKRDRRKPFRFTTRGTLKRPGGVSRAAGCKGKARITVKRKGSGKTLSSRLATVKNTCKFTSKVSFKTSRRFGKTRKARRRGTLVFTIRFQGNARLTSRTIKRTARYG